MQEGPTESAVPWPTGLTALCASRSPSWSISHRMSSDSRGSLFAHGSSAAEGEAGSRQGSAQLRGGIASHRSVYSLSSEERSDCVGLILSAINDHSGGGGMGGGKDFAKEGEFSWSWKKVSFLWYSIQKA